MDSVNIARFVDSGILRANPTKPQVVVLIWLPFDLMTITTLVELNQDLELMEGELIKIINIKLRHEIFSELKNKKFTENFI